MWGMRLLMYPKSPFFYVEQHYGRLMRESDRSPSSGFIASFGLNIGLYRKGTGEFYSKSSMTRKFLDSLIKVRNVDILIGFPGMRRNEHYKDFSYRKAMLKRAMQRWPTYNWRISEDSHLKCAGFEKRGSPYAIITGGRNLTDSGFSDLTLVVPKRQRKAIKDHFYELFNEASPVDL